MATAQQTAPPITVYTTPTCPWCVKAKELLQKEGVPFQTIDVTVNQAAALEMVRRSGQMGVPVIADASEAIVGFNVPRLKAMAQRNRRGLGLRVADHKSSPGAHVGFVRPDSPAARAGVQVDDVITELNGRPVTSADDLTQIAATRQPGTPTSITLRRHGEPLTLSIPG